MRRKQSIYRDTPLGLARALAFPILFTLTVTLAVMFGIGQARDAVRHESAKILEDGIRRAVAAAFVADGRYPGGIEYIEERYGIHIDRERFSVDYRIFAQNRYPQITVIANE